MSNLREWKIEDVNEIVQFKQEAARFGQETRLEISFDIAFCNEFTGDLSDKLQFSLPSGRHVYINKNLGPYVRLLDFKVIAGEPAKKFKQEIRELVAYGIGVLQATPIDYGEPL